MVSNHHKESPTWFADKNIMEKDFIANLPNYYNDNFKENNKVIKRHHQKYINDVYAPAWKTLEFFSFGQIFKIYGSLKNADLGEKIANRYGIKRVEIFKNYFKTMVFIRNICAHSGVLYDSKTFAGVKNKILYLRQCRPLHCLWNALKKSIITQTCSGFFYW